MTLDYGSRDAIGLLMLQLAGAVTLILVASALAAFVGSRHGGNGWWGAVGGVAIGWVAGGVLGCSLGVLTLSYLNEVKAAPVAGAGVLVGGVLAYVAGRWLFPSGPKGPEKGDRERGRSGQGHNSFS
jgi:hypothetical protein